LELHFLEMDAKNLGIFNLLKDKFREARAYIDAGDCEKALGIIKAIRAEIDMEREKRALKEKIDEIIERTRGRVRDILLDDEPYKMWKCPFCPTGIIAKPTELRDAIARHLISQHKHMLELYPLGGE